MKKKLVVLTGAGISKESGIDTFRDKGGTWEQYDLAEVCTLDGWRKDRQKVLDFYNKRREQLNDVHPNSAHIALAKLEQDYDVHIITQNVDDLHERAGSTKVLHLHGELVKACSSNNKRLTVPYGDAINVGDKHADGSQLRPFIVWFGEDVPKFSEAMFIVQEADVVVVIGTSMQVYPAASLKDYANKGTPVFSINPEPYEARGVEHIQHPATIGVPLFINKLNELYDRQ